MEIGDRVTVSREMIALHEDDLAIGNTCDFLDMRERVSTENGVSQVARYRIRIDHIGPEKCECTVIERLR
ncbi:hypothetical protein BEI_1025 [Halomonas beimenensis]|uniref:Uncharacterized protein n=1 Tax=Halomonas beimenensis TaxID=475662 RepID=A0A291P575_9GAMM|nr:hypothetical protein BEI_1025 [Halomonas beimenensis]